jgi:hypothetical protein
VRRTPGTFAEPWRRVPAPLAGAVFLVVLAFAGPPWADCARPLPWRLAFGLAATGLAALGAGWAASPRVRMRSQMRVAAMLLVWKRGSRLKWRRHNRPGSGRLHINGRLDSVGVGRRRFRRTHTGQRGRLSVSLSVADFNLDGIPDIGAANIMANSASVLQGTGGGAFRAEILYDVAGQPGRHRGRPAAEHATNGFGVSR